MSTNGGDHISPVSPDGAEAADPQEPTHLVIVGASAGGIEALSVLASSLPKDFPAPLVMAQHLDPTRPSMLDEIIRRRTSLPVVIVSDNTPLKPGEIYIVPANRHVRIDDGHISFVDDRGQRPRPSIDMLLSSAARIYGERLIGVILTGTGADGVSGVVEVKKAGGTVIVQNPSTARFPALPLALPPTAIDYVAELENIGTLLNDLVRSDFIHEPVAPEKAEDPLLDILKTVSDRSNIDFRSYKRTTIIRRVKRRIVATHTRSVEEYSEFLKADPSEVDELTKAFLIKVTEFFRDKGAFEYLKSTVLPSIIENARSADHTIRLWSAGCATGEEPYSLAMLIADLLGPELPQWNIRIFATDLDESAITFARRAIYPESVVNSLSPDYRARFIQHSGDGYKVQKFLRDMIVFGQQDLTRGSPFPRIDLVICRNLLIYFKSELQQPILNTFAYSLQLTGGYLFLGQAETVRPAQHNFVLVNKKWKIYQYIVAPSTPQYISMMSTAGRSHLPAHSHGGRDATAETPLPTADPVALNNEVVQLRRLNEALLRYLPVGVVIIDRYYKIVSINGPARRMLGILDIPLEQDFLHSVRDIPYAAMRGSIDKAFRDRTTEEMPDLQREIFQGEIRHLQISISPMPTEANSPDLAVVSVYDNTETVNTRQNAASIQEDHNRVLEEYHHANSRLTELNRALQDANEELQSTNEELLIAQEELQATNEEYEATNEELQATNEELETSNEELQATNEELETTNEELHARTGELEDMTFRLAAERLRLAEMAELAPFNMLVLRGPALLIEAFNPGVGSMLGRSPVVGEPLEDAFKNPDPTKLELIMAAHDAYRSDDKVVTRRLPIPLVDSERHTVERYFTCTIVPTHEPSGRVDGVIIYAEDVSDLMSREAREQGEKLTLMIEHADQVALAIFDADTRRLLQASRRYIDITVRATGYEPESLQGLTFEDLSFIADRDEALRLFEEVTASGEACRVPEIRRKLAGDNQETVWDYSLTPITYGEGDPAADVRFLVVSAVEVTEPVRAREELERVDEMKNMFLSLASHELRTPLVPLRGYAEMLGKLVNAPEGGRDSARNRRIAEYVGKFEKQLTYLNRLVGDLFDVARLQSGRLSLSMQSVDLVPLVRRAVDAAQIANPTPPVKFSVSPEDTEACFVNGDPERLQQVIENLLQNAFKYAPHSKQVDMRLRCAEPTDSEGDMDYAVLEVQDYGPGIAKEDLATIFERFQQAPHEERPAESGLGLGLFISRAIVEQHGGTISASSRLGKGTTITAKLPIMSEGK